MATEKVLLNLTGFTDVECGEKIGMVQHFVMEVFGLLHLWFLRMSPSNVLKLFALEATWKRSRITSELIKNCAPFGVILKG